MTKPGYQTAKLPVSPHANLSAVRRTGTNSIGSAVWEVACTCGLVLSAAAYAFRRGETKCPRCQPCPSDVQAMEILQLLPTDYDTLASKLGVNMNTLKSRVRAAKKHGFCHVGKWRRARGAGSYQPVFVNGPGEDAPCTLEPRPGAIHSRRYRKRIKRAIERALDGGKEDPRYVRHIALRKADQTAAQARQRPQTWCSALQL